jgi:hypothetical protein
VDIYTSEEVSGGGWDRKSGGYERTMATNQEDEVKTNCTTI